MSRKSTEEDFWKRVGPPNEQGCREWAGKRQPRGYGYLGYRGDLFLAHRLAFIFTYGPLLPEEKVRHTCDNPPCCEPTHLIRGTQAQNMRDAVERGRTRKGVDRPQAKLTELQVVTIRARHAAERITQQQLANEYGVTHTTIYSIVHRKKWAHVA